MMSAKLMKKPIAIILSVTLIGTLCLGFTGCKKNNNNPGSVSSENNTGAAPAETRSNSSEPVSSDEPWYESTLVTIDPGYEDAEYLMFSCPVVGGDYLYVLADGTRRADEDTDWENYNPDDYQISDLLKIDMNGNVVSKIPYNTISSDLVTFSSARFIDGKIEYLISLWQGESFINATVEYDTATDTFAEIKSLAVNMAYGSGRVDQCLTLSDGNLLISELSYDSMTYIFHVVSGETEVATLDFAQAGFGDVWHIQGFCAREDGNLVLQMDTGNETFTAVFDIDTYTIERSDENFDVDYFQLRDSNACDDGITYCVDYEGIKKINADTLSTDLMLDFANCNVNLNSARSMKLLSVSGDKYVLCGISDVSEVGRMQVKETIGLCVLTKADTNPNAGKSIIEIGICGDDAYLPEDLAEAVYEFNETDSGYYARFCFYELGNYAAEGLSVSDFTYTDRNNAALQMTNQLAIDLMSGDAPDVIINAGSYPQLNSDSYLMNLNDYIDGADGLDRSLFYENVWDAATMGGKLYQIPLSFNIEGLAVDTSCAPSNGIGYTYDEYNELVMTLGNGTNPMSEYVSRYDYFAEGLANIGDLLINYDDYTSDFGGEGFISFAEYCSTYIPENAQTQDGAKGAPVPAMTLFDGRQNLFENYPGDGVYTGQFEYAMLSTLSGYAPYTCLGQSVGFYGIGPDGRGPSILISGSAAISASSDVKDGAWAFIKFLLSDDIQFCKGYEYTNPVNKAACDAVSTAFMDGLNDFYESNAAMFEGYSAADLYNLGFTSCSVEQKDAYLAILASANHVKAVDSEILNIALEEIPAYFAGQKTLDEVCAVIDNRAQTVLDERYS